MGQGASAPEAAAMAESPPIRQLTFQNRKWPGLGLQVLWLSRLWRLLPDDLFSGPERWDFHVILLCTAGAGQLDLDFAPLNLKRGMLLHLRPGQVIQGVHRDRLEARVALFRPEFLSSDAAALDLPTALALEGHALRTLDRAFSDLQNEYAQTDASPESTALLTTLLEVILHRIAPLAGQPTTPAGEQPAQRELMRQFRRELENSFHTCRQVSHYAKRLGYAEKTLNRATQRAEGLPAKALIDARVLLEAKRLLVHTRQSIGAIARALGFSEATNFAKFFRRGAGCGPSAFRRQHQER